MNCISLQKMDDQMEWSFLYALAIFGIDRWLFLGIKRFCFIGYYIHIVTMSIEYFHVLCFASRALRFPRSSG